MKLFVLFLVTISISLSGTALQYQNLLFNSLTKTHETRSPQNQIDDTTNNGHTFELISTDHFLTTQDPTLTLQDLLSLRFQRDLHKAKVRSSSNVRKRIFSGYGTYLMRLGVGTPPQNVSMSLDTGCDIVWLQCSPCTKCHKQSDPIFNPSNSTTFSQIVCGSPRCKQLHYYSDVGCNNNTCLYDITYADRSFSKGAFSTETLKLGPGVSLKNISLGCGHDNERWLTELSAGVIGLGRGNLSFISQTKDQFQGQFSYCLAYWFSSNSSYIMFGPSALPGNAVYTPLVYTNTDDTLYYVNLTGISVGGTPVPGITPSVFDLKSNGFDGGVIFDSGTTYTQLIKPAYKALRKAFRAAFQNQTNSTVSVGSPLSYLWFDTCYNISYGMLDDVEVPIVELHFDQGANMTLPPGNTIPLMDANGTVATFCLAFQSDDFVTTIGNIQQNTFQMVYDLPGTRVGFVPDTC